MFDKELFVKSSGEKEKVKSSFFLYNIKLYLSKSKRKFVALILFILLTFIVFYFVFPEVSKEKSDELYDGKGESPFSVISQDIDNDLREYKEVFDEGINYWKDWDWKEDLIYSKIVFIDKKNSEMKIIVGPPPYEKISKKEILVNVKCLKSNTLSIKSRTPEGEVAVVTERSFNIFNKAKVGDMLITYCLDQGCLNVGKQCILVPIDNNSE